MGLGNNNFERDGVGEGVFIGKKVGALEEGAVTTLQTMLVTLKTMLVIWNDLPYFKHRLFQIYNMFLYFLF